MDFLIPWCGFEKTCRQPARLFPDREGQIEEEIDPGWTVEMELNHILVPKITVYRYSNCRTLGEYGAESRICRWIACFIFMLSNLVSKSLAAAATRYPLKCTCCHLNNLCF